MRGVEVIIEAKGLAQGYGRKLVFSGLRLSLGVGTVGLLGPNGAGKTTLLRTLATIIPPRQGTLRIDGRMIRRAAEVREARRRIGYLPQHFAYFPGFTVYEFVRYCAWLREVPEATAHEETERAIAAVNLTAQSGRKLRSLSGGMLRRCGIAQAIVGHPRVVLLDEPTVGLDPEQRLEFREIVRSLTDATVVLSTHLVEDVAAVCDRVLVMQGGEIRFDGTPDELAGLARPGARGDSQLERGYTTVLSNQVAA